MVKQFHVTKDGRKMLIAEMDDNHLENTIKYVLRQIAMAKALLDGNIKQSKFDNAIYGKYKQFDEEDLSDLLRNRTQIIQFYLGEAMLRGMSFTNELQEVFERNEKLVVASPFETRLMLENFDDVDEFPDDLSIEDTF